MGARWSEAELELLRDTSLSCGEVAQQTGRALSAVYGKAHNLGIDRSFFQGGKGKARSWQRGWEPWELELLAEPDIPLTDVAVMIGRSYSSVKHKASREGLVDIRDYWLRGEANWRFTGGQSPTERTYRGQTWPEVRLSVLERDGYTCQDGGEFIPSGKGLVVHHVIPYRLRPVNDPDWLATLCVTHHLKRPEHWWKTLPAHIEEQLVGRLAGGEQSAEALPPAWDWR